MNKLYERPKGNTAEIIRRAAQQLGLLDSEGNKTFLVAGKKADRPTSLKFAGSTWDNIKMPRPQLGWTVTHKHSFPELTMRVAKSDEKGVYVDPIGDPDTEEFKSFIPVEEDLERLQMSKELFEREGEYYIFAGDGFRNGDWILHDRGGNPVLPNFQSYSKQADADNADNVDDTDADVGKIISNPDTLEYLGSAYDFTIGEYSANPEKDWDTFLAGARAGIAFMVSQPSYSKKTSIESLNLRKVSQRGVAVNQ